MHLNLARLKPGDDERTEISKKISWILRHGAKKVGELGRVTVELCMFFFLFSGTWVCVIGSPSFCAFDAQDLWSWPGIFTFHHTIQHSSEREREREREPAIRHCMDCLDVVHSAFLLCVR